MVLREDFAETGLAGPLSLERLEAFETRLRVALPVEYRDFLLQMNGGVPRRRKLTFVNEVDEEEQDTEFEGYYSLNDGAYPDKWKWRLHESIERLFTDVIRQSFPESHMLPIGRDVAGNLICLSLNEKDAGTVYFFDHDYQQFYRLADTFESFHDGLGELEEADE